MAVEVTHSYGAGRVKYFEADMMLSVYEWSALLDIVEPRTPYMDEMLRQDPREYEIFIADLCWANLIVFMDRPFDLVASFFVAEEDGRLRTVVNCRVVNRCFHQSSKPRMAFCAKLAEFEIPEN